MASVFRSTARAVVRAKKVPTACRELKGGGALRRSQGATPNQSDADLLKLDCQKAALRSLYRRVVDRAYDLEDFGFPEVPRDLFFRPDDHRLMLTDYVTPYRDEGLWYLPACRVKTSGSRNVNRCLRQKLSDLAFWRSVDFAQEQERRITQIISAHDIYTDSINAAQAASGYRFLNAAADEMLAELKLLERRIEQYAPQTFAGLAIKARHLLEKIDPDIDIQNEVVLLLHEISRLHRLALTKFAGNCW